MSAAANSSPCAAPKPNPSPSTGALHHDFLGSCVVTDSSTPLKTKEGSSVGGVRGSRIVSWRGIPTHESARWDRERLSERREVRQLDATRPSCVGLTRNERDGRTRGRRQRSRKPGVSLRAISASVSNSKPANSTAVHSERDRAFDPTHHEVQEYWAFVGHRFGDRV